MFRFNNIYFLLLIPIIIVLFFLNRKEKNIKFSNINLIKKIGLKTTVKHLIGRYLILFGLILLTIGLARPQFGRKQTNIKVEGIDIIVSMDVSGSMESIDFKPSRLESAKRVTDDFIEDRKNDRIGVVIFSGTAYTKIPLTLDYDVLRKTVLNLSTKDVNKDGTAIGMGISVAVNRLKKSKAKSKIIILLTDGENNAGVIDPNTASDLAKDLGVKIYTIGIGSGKLILPYTDIFGNRKHRTYPSKFNDTLLKNIANKTGGKYFNAKDTTMLKEVFNTINKLEKVKMDTKEFYKYKEIYFSFVLMGLLLLTLGILLEKVIFIKIP